MDLEKKKLQIEKKKMEINIMECELRIEERLNDINRIKKTIDNYKQRIKEIQEGEK